jgi:hypothetical protein
MPVLEPDGREEGKRSGVDPFTREIMRPCHCVSDVIEGLVGEDECVNVCGKSPVRVME